MIRSSRSLAPLAFACALGAGALVAGCGGQNPYQAAESANTAVTVDTVATGDGGIAANDFIPGENIGSCVGTVERPNCGSKSKGGWRMSLTFGVLFLGMGFIGWRIARSVRARDAVMNRVDERVE